MAAHTEKNDLRALRKPSVFECDPATLDVILGRGKLGERNLRFDAAHLEPTSKQSAACTQPSGPEATSAVDAKAGDIRYATSGLQEPLTRVVRKKPPTFEIDRGLQQERLKRLLDQQQAWYDEAQMAASAAEQLLQLCEHHQQLWLQDSIRT